jgi:hypothetical protein
MSKKTLIAFATIAAFSAFAADPAVKKSDSGICHDASSSSYGNTKKFTPFNTIDECIKSGGKLPAGAKSPCRSSRSSEKV